METDDFEDKPTVEENWQQRTTTVDETGSNSLLVPVADENPNQEFLVCSPRLLGMKSVVSSRQA